MSAGPVTAAAPGADVAATRGESRTQLAKLAAEFESLLLANVLRDMRSAGRWSEEDSPDTLGAGAFGQTFDTELARNLSQAGGFGLSAWLMKAFDRYGAAAAAGASTAPAATLTGAASTGLVEAPAPTRLISAPPSSEPLAESPGADPLRPTAALTSPFGWRKDPLTGALSFHRGVDLKAAEGDAVAATADGRVVFSGRNGGYGTSVVVEHAGGVSTRYAHLSEALVTAGDTVRQGQSIGRAGKTGRATGAHLHYEVLDSGRPVDPLR